MRAAVAERLGEARFGLWFGEGVRLGVSDDALEVGVPNAFFREWIQGHFAGNLVEAAEAVAGRPLRLTFRVDDEAEPKVGHVIEPGPRRASRRQPDGHDPDVPRAPEPPTSDRPSARRNPSRPRGGSSDFVTGPCNRLAHAAAVEMVQSRGGVQPPGHSRRRRAGQDPPARRDRPRASGRHPGLRLVQVTAEAFTNGFLDAMRAGALASFRSRFRGAEALIVDDVHFLAAKRATQDEFLHTFNALVADGAPIVLAADQHPG